MKFVFALLMLSAFQVQASEAPCWEAQSPVVAGIPQEICFESVERQGGRLELKTADNVYTTNGLELIDSEQGLYSAEAVLVEDYEVCGRSILANLNVVGNRTKTFSGEELWIVKELEVRYSVTPDSCHSRPRKGVITYKLK